MLPNACLLFSNIAPSLQLPMINISIEAAGGSIQRTIYQGLLYHTAHPLPIQGKETNSYGWQHLWLSSCPARSCSCRQPIDETCSIFIGTASVWGFLLAACLSRNSHSAGACGSRIRTDRGASWHASIQRKCTFFLFPEG